MDQSTELLFNDFPRSVGLTREDVNQIWQFFCLTPEEFTEVVEAACGIRNVYASISSVKPVVRDGYEGNAVTVDKVLYDFDSPAKAGREEPGDWQHHEIPETADDKTVISMMEDDTSILYDVLGDPCRDARQLAQQSQEDGIPVVGVFSGFGIHVYQLFEPIASRPDIRVGTTARKYIEELSLPTADTAIVGDQFRIARVPNMSRVDHDNGGDTGIYTIPLRGAELADITPEDVLSMSYSPRPNALSEPSERPYMTIHEDYVTSMYSSDERDVDPAQMRTLPDVSNASDIAKEIVKQVVRMPCVYEHAIGPNPDNSLRVKLGIMLLNSGMSVMEADGLIQKLNWVDYDKEITRYQLSKLKKSGKGDYSCRTMMRKGFCVNADKPKQCETYGYRGGNSPPS